jgi:hypothetical protein
MNRLGNVVRAAVAAAVFVMPVAAAVASAPTPAPAPVMDTTTQAGPGCCTGTPWGQIGEPAL